MFTLLVCLADQKSYRSYVRHQKLIVCSHLVVRTHGVLKNVSYWEGPSEVQPLTLL